MRAFLGRHTQDDGLDVLEGIVVDVHVLDGLAHPRYHAGQVLQAAHLLNLLNLAVEVVEVKLVLLYLPLQPACLLLIILRLSAFHQRHDVTHAQDAVCHSAGVEGVEGIHLLARTHEHDGFVHDASDAQGSTASGVTIQLGEDDASIVKAVVELLGRIDSILTRHGIHHEENLVGLHRIAEVLNLLHQLLVHSLPTSGIDDEHIESLSLGMLYGITGNAHRVGGTLLEMDRHPNLFAQDTQLFHGSRAEGVAGSQQRIAVLLLAQELSQLAAHGRLARTIQTSHQDNGRMALQVHAHRLAAHQFRQLIVHNLHHQLLRLDGSQHILSQGFLLDRISKVLSNFVVDIGIEQGTTHILQSLSYINLGDFALTFQYLERPLKPFA